MPQPPLIVGNPVLVVVDIQRGGAMPAEDVGIAHMPGHADRVSSAERLVAAARAANVPVVFFQEVHRPSGVDIGRELDGTEGMHCVEVTRAPNWNPRLGPISVAPAPSSTSSSVGTRASSAPSSRSCCAHSRPRR